MLTRYFHVYSDSQASVLTVTKILEPQDKHVVSVGEYTLSSTGFPSTSEHVFNAHDILRRYVFECALSGEGDDSH